MKITAQFAGALLGAMTFSGAALASVAGPTTSPGERAGLDLASPLPEGLYFIDIGSVGSWRATTGANNFNYNVPVLAWSTPWTLLGGRIQFLGALPEIEGASKSGAYVAGLYNPFVAAQIAWNLGAGFSASYLAGAYIGIPSTNITAGGNLAFGNPLDETTFHQQLALAWHGGGWNATANLMYGFVTNNANPTGMTPQRNGDYFNYDLGLTRTLGKWEVGMVGYGSVVGKGVYTDPRLGADTSVACGGCAQFAVGGLVGYNFGPVITQVTLSRDIYATISPTQYAQKETRAVLRAIVPLWTAEAPKPVEAKY